MNDSAPTPAVVIMPTCLICNQSYERKPVISSNNENSSENCFNGFKEAFTLFGDLVKAKTGRVQEDADADDELAEAFPFPSSSTIPADDHPCCDDCLMKLLELQRHQKIIDEAKQAQNESVSNFLEEINTSSKDSSLEGNSNLNPMWEPLRKSLIKYSKIAHAEVTEAETDLGMEIEEENEDVDEDVNEEVEIDYHFNYKQEPEPTHPPPLRRHSPRRQSQRKKSGRPPPEPQAEFAKPKVSLRDQQPKIKFNGNVDKKAKVKNLFKCDECDFTSKYKSLLIKHAVKHRKTGTRVSISEDCPRCGQHFTSECLYLRHINQNHGKEKPIWSCDEIISSKSKEKCGKVFKNRSLLKTHKMMKHKISRPRCHSCQIDCSTPSNFLKHQKTKGHLRKLKQMNMSSNKN